MDKILEELAIKYKAIDHQAVEKFVDILASQQFDSICGFGAGRMGYSLRAFIMRLDHIGLNAFMIGDTNFPRLTTQTLVVVNSSSGETPSIRLYAEQAAEVGSKIITITDNPKSSLASLSNLVINTNKTESSQIMKSLNEQFSFILFDLVCEKLITTKNLDRATISRNHSISE